MKSPCLFFGLVSLLSLPSAWAQAPTAQTLNGTYEGVYLSDWDQDAFLGIPYAQPPVGELRYRWPQSINSSFDGVRDATQYGYSCMQYASTFNISEDCLNINVIRPSGNLSESLPVLVWIYGGGLVSRATPLSCVPQQDFVLGADSHLIVCGKHCRPPV